MRATEIFLPLPPSANKLWRYGQERVFKSPEYQSWLEEAGYKLNGQHPRPVPGPYKLTILAQRPPRRHRDLGNLEKALSDILVRHKVVDDDAWCDAIFARWVTTGEGVALRIEPAGVE